MRKLRTVLIGILSLVLVFSMSGCSTMISQIIKDAAQSEDKDGDDYITYTNADRKSVTGRYVGEKVDDAATEPLLDNIELTYDEVEGSSDSFYVYIDNSNKNYFYDGVIRLESESQKYKINVDMLAPDTYEYFTMQVEGTPDDYDYYVEGNLYKWAKDLEINYDYSEYVISEEDYSEYVVVDTASIDESVLKAFSSYLYDYDTLYNFENPVTYYILTEDEYVTDGSSYDYMLYVDTGNQQVVATDASGNEVFTDKM